MYPTEGHFFDFRHLFDFVLKRFAIELHLFNWKIATKANIENWNFFGEAKFKHRRFYFGIIECRPIGTGNHAIDFILYFQFGTFFRNVLIKLNSNEGKVFEGGRFYTHQIGHSFQFFFQRIGDEPLHIFCSISRKNRTDKDFIGVDFRIIFSGEIHVRRYSKDKKQPDDHIDYCAVVNGPRREGEFFKFR